MYTKYESLPQRASDHQQLPSLDSPLQFVNLLYLNYLGQVVPPFYINGLSRKDEVVIHRIRIGHSRLTHSFLMEDALKRKPRCNFCYNERLRISHELTVKHIMIECKHFNNIRLRYHNAKNMGDLFERFPLRYIIEFLKESGLYNLI